ncbi:MAG: CvpA family protein [Verrucomicrobiae bacterium]|nr:CvpA family protein [Verrucomicrobiae bacterium]
MSFEQLPFNWFDLVLGVVLLMGLFHGRKRGMSEELLIFLQWVAIVVVSAMLYQPLGERLVTLTSLSRLTCYVTAYVLAGIGVTLLFLLFKRFLHGKLLGSDVFGRAEYYLGMMAGMTRFGCALLAGLALLNARAYTQEEIRAHQAYQTEVYGSEYFPGLQTLQANVFEKSLTGPLIRTHLGFLLIKPTHPEGRDFKQKEWTMP